METSMKQSLNTKLLMQFTQKKADGEGYRCKDDPACQEDCLLGQT